MDWRNSLQTNLKTGFAAPGPWLVGVSGGGDSVALLRLLAAWGYGKRLTVAHVNHRWSPWGDDAETFTQEVCKQLKIKCLTGYGSGKPPGNAEALAREERHAFFAQKIAEIGANGILLAHTRTDVMESVLMRLGKGSGLTGLANAGRQKTPLPGGGTLWRPLLTVSRANLRAYLAEIGQTWLEDPDNEAGGSQRARLRKLLPALEAAGVAEEAVFAAMLALQDAETALQQATEQVAEEITHRHNGAQVVEREALLALPAELALRTLLSAFFKAFPGQMPPRRGKWQALLARMAEKPQGTSQLGGLRFTWEPALITIRPT